MDHFNQLSPAELERLAYLAEEMCEAGQIIGKIIRHGYESRDPTKAVPVTDDNRGGTIGRHNSSPTNRHLLETELGDVLRAVKMMTDAGDLKSDRLHELSQRLPPLKYMHHHQICEKEPV